MNFDKFFDQISDKSTEINITEFSFKNSYLLNNEALFQLPLISLIILVLAKDRRKPRVSEVGQLVGESIEESLAGFKGSAQHIGWSANLRVRTVKAITFLESAQLIVVNNRKSKINITDLGKKVIKKAMLNEDDLAYNLAVIARSYRNICVSRQLDLEL